MRKLTEFPISNPPRVDERTSPRVEAGFPARNASHIEAGGQFPNNKEVEFVLYLEEDVDLELPENFRKEIFLPAYKRDDLIRKIWWEKFSLPKRAKQDGCDVLISMYQCATVAPRGMKHIMVVHDVLLEFFPEYLNNARKKSYWFATKHAIRKADRIIAVSHRTEKDLAQRLGIDAHTITVSYIDVDDIYKKDISSSESDAVLKKYGLKKGYIYSGGGLEMRKNTEGTLRAYKILLDNYASMMDVPQLVISGKMMPQLAPLVTDVEQLVEGLELNGHVKLLGFAPQEDLPALYKNASLFVYPSYYEGFGLPVLEAMNQGIPVITAKTSSLPEVGGDSVLYCKPDDIDDLAMVMRNVLINGKLRNALSSKGQERAKRFSWQHFTEKMFHIIESM